MGLSPERAFDVLAQEESPPAEDQTILRDVDSPELSELTDPNTVIELVTDAFAELAGDILGRLPLMLLAALGLIGLGIALALQNILENLISGVLILIRKPYDRGEIIITEEVEGYVEDIDLRVTTIRTYDGTLVLVPNADIFRAPITNLSRRGTRRTTLHIGIDYRDDHERARELLYVTVDALPEVLAEPPPQVLLTGLGDSSVDFEVRVWFEVEVGVPAMQDLCYRACKTALDDAGITIPWPIRTLAADMQPLQVERRAVQDPAELEG